MPTNPTITPSVSVIVPAMNEARNLPHVLPMIPTWVDEVILVDGNSTDDTVEVAQRLIPSVRVIPQHGKGKGAFGKSLHRCGQLHFRLTKHGHSAWHAQG